MPPAGTSPPRADPFPDGPPIWDYDHDGTYTCEEWKRYMDQLFRLADRNRDGFLDAAEFPAIGSRTPRAISTSTRMSTPASRVRCAATRP
ncbi:hypothetical protein [Bradyrhizobium liaoningense]|uniref:hypothetical protein n=1 Tax=Bradyrhizobium liaoningense TaxID=43992 RepID=UPI003D9B0CEE